MIREKVRLGVIYVNTIVEDIDWLILRLMFI